MTVDALNPSAIWECSFYESPNDRKKIRYCTWKNKRKDPEYGILLVNGRGEWIEKYSHIPPQISPNKSVLWLSIDHQGQGLSEGTRAHINSYREFVDNLTAISKLVFSDLPFYIVAHSMGGLVSLVACLSGEIRPAAMVLCSPLLRLPPQPLPEFMSRALVQAINKTHWKKFESGAGKNKNKSFPLNTLTHSLEGFHRYKRSPYPPTTPTFGWISATISACDYIFEEKNIKKLSCPLKIIFGSEEYIVDPAAYSEWCSTAKRVSTEKIELIKLPRARHELLSEIPKLQTLALSHINRWIDHHTLTKDISINTR
jgi:lysophospholipase